MTIDNRGLTDKDVLSYMDSLSNWGKWGPEDQLGALNYLTEAKRQQASSLIQGRPRSVSGVAPLQCPQQDERPPGSPPDAGNRR